MHFALVDIANARLSPDQLTEIDPMRSLLDRGIEVAIGSDSVVAPGNPYLDIFFALIQPTRPSEALTVEQAVIAYTRTAAAADFQEQRLVRNAIFDELNEMLLRSLPDLAQSTAEFQSWFQSKWGRENCIIWGQARQAEFGPCTHTLSIRAAWGGVEHCYVNGRTLAVDDDNFLILNHGQIYCTSIRAVQPVESLSICFKPELAEQIYGEASASIEQALARGDTPAERTPDFMENLHPHENTVSPVLRFIRAHISRGVLDEAWYDEQLVFLLARMQCHHQRLLEQVDGIALIRPATRREVYRRISLATDFMHTHYAQDVDLTTLAKIAYLSKYHFLRLFSLVHGMTPRTYLQRKRISVAIRLLESTRMTMSEVAASVGFAEGSTFARQMRRWTQLTPRQVRARVLDGRAA